MGPSKAVLLVDSDTRSLRVLEVSLKRAGYEVLTAETAAGALQSALSSPPDLVVTDTQLPDYDGFELARRLKAEPATAGAALIFLSQDSSAEAKISAINAGAESYLTKPVLVREILGRIDELIERQRTESAIASTDRSGSLSGTLGNMRVVDILQLMESGRKSGIVHLSTDPQRSGGYATEAQSRGALYFRDGQVVDAKVGTMAGLEAVYRTLLWEDGVFELEFKPVTREDEIRETTQTILLEGMRRVDEWSKFAERVPSLSTRLAIDYSALTRAYPEIPEVTQSVLHLFDGRRTLIEVIDEAPLGDSDALRIIDELNERGVLTVAERRPSVVETVPPRGADIEAWLSGDLAGRNGASDDVTRMLGESVIPSPRTPSEIIGRHDPRAAGATIPAPQILDAPAEPKKRTPSIVLSRHRVAANEADAPVPTDRSTADMTSSASVDVQRPTLTVKRMASVLEPAPGPVPTPAWPSIAPAEDEEATVADVPAPALTRPAFSGLEARAPTDGGGSLGRVPVGRSEGFVRAPSIPPAPAPAEPEPAASLESPANPSVADAPTLSDTVPSTTWPQAQPAPTEPLPTGADTVPSRAPATVPAFAAIPAPQSPTAGPQTEKAAAPLAPAESVGGGVEDDHASRDFFTAAKSEVDIEWDDDGGGWKRRLPGLLLAACLVAVILALALGGQKNSEPEETTTAAATTEAAEEGKADWPATPEDAVVDDKPRTEVRKAPEVVEASAAAQMPPAEPETGKVDNGAPTEAAAPPPAAAPMAAADPAEPEAPVRDVDKAAKLVKRGDAARRQERYKTARRRYREALKADPENAGARAGMAMAWVNEGNDKRALYEARRAIKIDRSQAQAHLALGLVYSNKGDFDRAKRYFRTFLKYEPRGKTADEIRRVLSNQP